MDNKLLSSSYIILNFFFLIGLFTGERLVDSNSIEIDSFNSLILFLYPTFLFLLLGIFLIFLIIGLSRKIHPAIFNIVTIIILSYPLIRNLPHLPVSRNISNNISYTSIEAVIMALSRNYLFFAFLV